MALNRYLYPQKGTNIVQECTLSTRVSLSGAGAVTGIVAGKGLTVTAGATNYTVTFDNASTVSGVLNVNAQFITNAAFDKTKHQVATVRSTSSTGCVIELYDLQLGTAALADVAGDLCITIVCTLSSVGA